MPSTTRPLRIAALLLALLLLPRAAGAHTGLQRASPADGDSLAAAPEALRLTFFSALEVPLATAALIGPDGAEVALAPLRAAEGSDREVVADIVGPLAAGTYTVRWQAVSADGHPVRGEYRFHILPGAAGLAPQPPAVEAPAATAAPAATPEEAPSPGSAAFDSRSPLYAAVRWLTFAGLLGAIGIAAFRAAVLPGVRRRDPAAADDLEEPAARAAASVGLAAGAVLAVALVLRLAAQSYAVSGRGPLDGGPVGVLITQSTWGIGWLLQAAGTLLVVAGFAWARAGRRPGWIVAGAGALALCASPALSGHAAASEPAALAQAADALHVLGAGGWLGSLLAVVVVGIPVALRLPAERRGPAARALVHAFSPAALGFAALVASTGVVAAWIHLGGLPALWGSDYGRTLLLKLALLGVVFGAGAYNWLRVRPALGAEAAAHRLRRSAAVELAAGALVLAVTAVLVATPPPMHREPPPGEVAAGR